MAIETNLNQSPYFDDFNENKNFHRVLFRPGYAVQARELTQLQSILQNQIERFANEILVDGTVISGCGLSTDTVGYVKVKDKNASGGTVLLSQFYESGVVANAVVEGVTSGMTARLADVADGSELAAPDYFTLFVHYTNSGANNTTKAFVDGETLLVKRNSDSVQLANVVTIDTSSTGLGLKGGITDGIVYHKGNFIRVAQQSVIIGKYTRNPSKKVGIRTVESIVDSNEDSSLLDNATGATNFAAPGASRLKLTPTLTTYDYDFANTVNFFQIATIKDGSVEQRNEDTVYSDIGKYIAAQAYDTNGNYVTDPFNIRIREHLKKTRSLGRYTSAEGGDGTLLVAEIEKGRGYVNGFKIEQYGASYINIDKATDYDTADGVAVSQAMGNYVICNEVAGSWNFDALVTVELHSTAGNAVSAGTYSGTSAKGAGTKIGEAKLRGLQWHNGTKGTPTGQYRFYIFDIQMEAGSSFSDTKCLFINDGTGSSQHSFADPVLESGNAVVKEPSLTKLIFTNGFFGTKKYADSTDTVDTQWVVRKRLSSVSVATDGTASITVGNTAPGGSEDFNDGGSSISNTDERNYIIISKTATNSANLTGTISDVSGTSVTGSGTAFDTDYRVGDVFQVNIAAAWTVIGHVASIESATAMTLQNTALATFSGATNAHRIHYPVGYIWDTQARGTLTEPSGTLTIDLERATLDGFTAEIYYNVLRTSANPTKKTVFKNKFIHVNIGSHSAGQTGPWSLGVSDAYQLVAVYKGSNTAVTTSDTDVTSSFEIVTGQKDSMYDTSYLKLRDGASLSLADADGLMVKFNYFGRDTSTGYGFLTFDSYADIIDDDNPEAASSIVTQTVPIYISPTTGISYDLRDCIDFRPKKTNVVTPSGTGTVVSAPTNPAVTTAFSYTGNYGIYMPTPDENFQADIQYYLPRRDRVVVSQRGTFLIEKGIPSLNPRTPLEPSGVMTLAIVEVPPYPSLSPYVAKDYGRTDYQVLLELENNRRYTMRDLRGIEQRIKNLEYYSTLNAIETSTQNKQLFNDSGLDRFKNGFFVDNFSGHQNADVRNRNYRAAIDKIRQVLRPTFRRSDIKLAKDVGLTSTNATQTGALVTLPYTHETLIDQPYATKLRNPVQELLFNWRGQVVLNPEADNTPDITTLPDIQIDFEGINSSLQSLIEFTGLEEQNLWGDWTTVGRTRERTGIDFNVETTSESINFGNFITDVSVREYMRSIEIQFTGVRMRPSTRVYAYFDNEKVSAYCTPTDSSFNPTGEEGDALTTDASGTVYGLFRLPNDDDFKFRVGTKEFKLMDIEDPITEIDIKTTTAIGSFTSQGLDIVQRGASVNMVFPQISKEVVTETQTWHTVADGDRGWWDPIAQSFAVNVSGATDGVFVTKIDLFFGRKSSTLPITLQIREMQTGFPIATIVPYGQKTLQPGEINIWDGTGTPTATTFTFDNPVKLLNNVDYALVVVPGGNSDDYAVWTAELGGIDTVTGLLIPKQTYPGILFTSANDNTWNPIQSEDLMFKIYRAKFDTTVTGTVYVENDDMDFMNIDNRTGTIRIGETVRAESVLTFSNNDSVSVGDILFSKESANTLSANYANGTIRQIVASGSGSVTVKVDAFGNFPTTASSNTNCLYLNSASRADAAWIGNTSAFSANTATGKVHFIDTTTGKLHVTDVVTTQQTGAGGHYGFANNNTWLRGQRSGSSLRMTSIENLDMNTLVPKIPQIKTPRTSARWDARLTSNTGVISSSYTSVDLSQDNDFTDATKRVYSVSNEQGLSAVGGSTKTLTLRGTWSTNKDTESPVIDTTRMNGIRAYNVINNDSTNEETNNGNALVRYISKTIELEDGQDAEDMIVFLTAYKPVGTGIKLYAKILNAEDPESIDDKTWSEMRQVTASNTFSEGLDGTNFREFEFTFSANTDGQNFLANSQLTTALLDTNDSNIVGYNDSNGAVYKSYKTYKLKIVMTASGSQVVPFVDDMRAIALQK